MKKIVITMPAEVEDDQSFICLLKALFPECEIISVSEENIGRGINASPSGVEMGKEENGNS